MSFFVKMFINIFKKKKLSKFETEKRVSSKKVKHYFGKSFHLPSTSAAAAVEVVKTSTVATAAIFLPAVVVGSAIIA